MIESGTYSFEMFYALDGLPVVKTAPRTVTITVLSASTVSPFKFAGASPGFQYLVEEESVLELNFELENTELNDFTIDLQVVESANRFTVAKADKQFGQGHVNFLVSPLVGHKGTYLISFTVTEIFDKVICPDPSS